MTMLDKIRSLLLRNLGLKLIALGLAIVVWAVLAGKERTYSEKTIQLPVEIANIAPNIEIKSIRPEWVQITVLGNGSRMVRLGAEDFQCRIDLQNISEGTRLSYFSEDLLVMPKGVSLTLVSIHPKMIEITLEELISREIPIRARIKGHLPVGLQLVETRVVPDRITIKGIKSQISRVTFVNTEEIDLSSLTASTTKRVNLVPDKYVPLGTVTGVDVTLVISRADEIRINSK
jgi:YbbR domain-containing protein